jgi:hypothetical protein
MLHPMPQAGEATARHLQLLDHQFFMAVVVVVALPLLHRELSAQGVAAVAALAANQELELAESPIQVVAAVVLEAWEIAVPVDLEL